ncbi:MAG: hypothetical protein V5A39_13710, partial [Haloarculaceae archaeon]
TELIGSNRPLIKYREKTKYAEVVCDLERIGHGFSADDLAALEAVRADYVERVAVDSRGPARRRGVPTPVQAGTGPVRRYRSPPVPARIRPVQPLGAVLYRST